VAGRIDLGRLCEIHQYGSLIASVKLGAINALMPYLGCQGPAIDFEHLLIWDGVDIRIKIRMALVQLVAQVPEHVAAGIPDFPVCFAEAVQQFVEDPDVIDVVDGCSQEASYLGAADFDQILRVDADPLRLREVDGKTTVERRYYLASLPLGIETFARAVRSHWAVENSLHWVLDMIFRDDECRVRTDHAPANFTTLKHMAHNIIRKAPGKDSLRLKRKVAAWDDEFLVSLVAA